MFKTIPFVLAGEAVALGLALAPLAHADTPSGPQPKVDCGSIQNCWGTVDNVRWFSQPDGSEEVHYDASTLASNNLEGDAKRETVMVLNVAHTTFPNAPEVTVVVEGNMCDEYGNCSRKPAARWIYYQSTLNRINYDNVDPDNIWNLADGGSVIANNWT